MLFTEPSKFAWRSYPLESPYLDCWRLSIESKGALLSPEGGEPVDVGSPAQCRYNTRHRPPVAGCECGYYAVAGGHFDVISCFFGSDVTAAFRTNGVVLYWAQSNHDMWPVLTKIRLYEPWTDSHSADGAAYRGNRFDIIGPAYAMTDESAARLQWLGVPVQVVSDLEATARAVLT